MIHIKHCKKCKKAYDFSECPFYIIKKEREEWKKRKGLIR